MSMACVAQGQQVHCASTSTANGQRQTINVVPASETKYEFGTLGIGPVQRAQVVDVLG
jgi:hypothetical protein